MDNIRGSALMVLAMAGFALEDTFIKFLSADLPVGQILFLMGIGGGTFGVPLLTLYNVAVHRAVATAAGFGLIIAIPSVIGFG